MVTQAQDIMNQIQAITGQYGYNISATRIVRAATPVINVFGKMTNGTTATFKSMVIIESLKQKLVPTLAGAKNMEILKMIVFPDIFIMNDEITYEGHVYRVNQTEPVPFMGTDLVEFISAAREVD